MLSSSNSCSHIITSSLYLINIFGVSDSLLNKCFLENNIYNFDTDFLSFANKDSYKSITINEIINLPFTKLEPKNTDLYFYQGSVKNNQKESLYFNEGVMIKKIMVGDSKPTSGINKKGYEVINSNPTIGGFMGWVCVADGTPGVWKGYGMIEDN